jgi:hypothetical protein
MLALLAFSLPSAEGPAAAPVALVLSAKGDVALQRGKGKPVRAGEASLLFAGDRLRAAKGAALTLVFLADGHRERLRPGAKALVGDKGCEPAGSVEQLASRKPSRAQLSSLRQHVRSIHASGGRAAVGVLRSEPDGAPAVTPMFGARVLTTHPTLTWAALPKAESYEVELRSGADGADERLLWRHSTTATSLPYPEEEDVLAPGLKYRWRVLARLKGAREQVVAESKFFVARKAQIAEAPGLRALAASADPADWLLAAAAYEAEGVYDRALPLYERLARQAPDNLDYQLALVRYYVRAGRKDEARKAQERVKALEAKGKE